MLVTAAPAVADIEELGRTQYLLIPGVCLRRRSRRAARIRTRPGSSGARSRRHLDHIVHVRRPCAHPRTRSDRVRDPNRVLVVDEPRAGARRLFRLVNWPSRRRESRCSGSPASTRPHPCSPRRSAGQRPGGQTALTGSGTRVTSRSACSRTPTAPRAPVSASRPGRRGGAGDVEPLLVHADAPRGIIRRGPQQGVTRREFSWTVGNALDNNWSAALIGVRSAPSTPTLGPVSVTTPAVGSRTSRTRSPATAAAEP